MLFKNERSLSIEVPRRKIANGLLLIGAAIAILSASSAFAQSLAYDDPRNAESLVASDTAVVWSSSDCGSIEFEICIARRTYNGWATAPYVSSIFSNQAGNDANNIASNIAAHDYRLYWLSEGGEILSRSLGVGSGNPTVVGAMVDPNALGEIAVTDPYIYWLENSGGIGRLYRMPRTGGGTPELMAESPDSEARDLQIDSEGRAYFLATRIVILPLVDIVHQVASDGAGGFTTTFSPRVFAEGYALSSDSIYAASRTLPSADITIARGDLSDFGSAASWIDYYTAGSIGSPSIRHLVIDEGFVYWHEDLDVGGSSILQMPLGGGPAQAISFSVAEAADLVVSGSNEFKAIYYRSGGDIWRLFLDGPALTRDLVGNEIQLEVTQAIQDAAHTIPLVESKQTFVRAYGRLDFSSNGATSIYFSPAMMLEGTRGGVPLPGSPLRPLGNGQRISDQPVDRANTENQVLFELPESWTSGTVTLTTTLDPNDLIFETDELNNTSSRTVSFDPVDAICIDIIPVRSTFGAERGGSLDLRNRTFARASSLLPTHDLFWISRGGTPKSKPFTGDPYNFSESDDVNEMLYHWWHDFVFASEPPECEGARTIRTAVVGSAARFGISSGTAAIIFYLQVDNGGVPSENRPDGGVSGLAHEVGHQLGQSHVGCPMSGAEDAPAFPDGSYPYNSCSLEDDNLDHIGFDPVTRKLIVPYDGASMAQYRDYMSYQENFWTSDYVYRRHFNELESDTPSPPVAGAGPLLVAGYQRADGSVEIGYSYLLDAPSLARAEDILGDSTIASADYRVRIYDDTDTLQVDEPLRIATVIVEEEGDESITPFFGLVPTGASFEDLEIVDGAGTSVLAQATYGVNPPTVSITGPAFPSTLGDTVTLNWSGSDPDADPLEYRVLFSHDNGMRWIDLVTTRSTTVDIPMVELPTGSEVIFKVMASDGIRSSEDILGPFVVPNRAPNVALFLDDFSAAPMLPVALSVPFGTPYLLRGTARDSNDGRLDGASLSWSLVGPETRAGSGEEVSVDGLMPGTYAVTFEATDSGGLTASESMQLVVEGKSIASSSAPELDGRCEDLAYGADVNPVVLRDSSGGIAEVSTIESGGELFVCVAGLPTNQGTGYFELRIDADGSGDALMQDDDYYLAVYLNGEVEVGAGDGAGGDAPDAGDAEVVALSHNAGVAWEAEIRIPASLLGADAALAFRSGPGAGLTSVSWPSMFDPVSPATWGGVSIGPVYPDGTRVISWEGVLGLLDTDTGQSVFSSAVLGQTLFSGYHAYADECSGNCVAEVVDATETNYIMPPIAGELSGSGVNATSSETIVTILNDVVVDADFVASANQFGTIFQVGDLLDGWRITSGTGPNGTPTGVRWSLIYLYVSTSPFDSTDFRADPPPFADLVVFVIEEGEDGDIYEAFGEANFVPEPAFGILLGVGCVALAGFRRRA